MFFGGERGGGGRQETQISPTQLVRFVASDAQEYKVGALVYKRKILACTNESVIELKSTLSTIIRERISLEEQIEGKKNFIKAIPKGEIGHPNIAAFRAHER